MDVLEIRLLGPLRVISDTRGDLTPSGRRAQAILAMVALSEHGERSRAWLQAKLWSDRPSAQSSGSLRQELTKVRRLLGPAHVVTEGDRVCLRAVRVDVLDIVNSGTVASSFIAAEVPDLLEGLEIRDEEFEDWLRLERAHWRDRVEAVARNAVATDPHRNLAEPRARLEEHPRERVEAARALMPARRPTIGILPCVVRSESPELRTIGELLCDLAAKMLIENGYYAVFDFRDLSGNFAEATDRPGNPATGPDLLLTVRLSEVVNMIEIAVGVRHVADGRVIWTQSYASERVEPAFFTGGRISEFVGQAVEAVETWLMRNVEDERHAASRLMLAATHQAFSLKVDDLSAAERHLTLAFELDPTAVQLGLMAMLESARYGEQVGGDHRERIERVRMLTARALEIDRGNSLALALLGHANAFIVRDFETAAELISEALQINPHRAACWDAQAMLKAYTGDAEGAYAAALRGRMLGRYSPYAYWYEASCGIAATLTGRHAEAVRHGRMVLAQRANYHPTVRHLIASLALEGDLAAANEMYQRLRTLEPGFSIAKLRDEDYPTPSPESAAMIEAGLVRAGVAMNPD